MGNDAPKQAPKAPPVDLNEVLIGMKLKSKMFLKSASKALKEKDKYYAQAKKQMLAGNEEGAAMYMELVQAKIAENKQFMRMGIRLETLACSMKSKENSVAMVGHLDAVTPVLEMQSTNMPIEAMYAKLERFNGAYDDLTIKGNILEDGMKNALGETGTNTNTNLMDGLRAEVQMEVGAKDILPTNNVADTNAQQQSQANNDFYANLQNI